jgi:hypothetical protein
MKGIGKILHGLAAVLMNLGGDLAPVSFGIMHLLGCA